MGFEAKYVGGNPDEPVIVTGPGDEPGTVRVVRLTTVQLDDATLTAEPYVQPEPEPAPPPAPPAEPVPGTPFATPPAATSANQAGVQVTGPPPAGAQGFQG